MKWWYDDSYHDDVGQMCRAQSVDTTGAPDHWSTHVSDGDGERTCRETEQQDVLGGLRGVAEDGGVGRKWAKDSNSRNGETTNIQQQITLLPATRKHWIFSRDNLLLNSTSPTYRWSFGWISVVRPLLEFKLNYISFQKHGKFIKWLYLDKKKKGKRKIKLRMMTDQSIASGVLKRRTISNLVLWSYPFYRFEAKSALTQYNIKVEPRWQQQCQRYQHDDSGEQLHNPHEYALLLCRKT